MERFKLENRIKSITYGQNCNIKSFLYIDLEWKHLYKPDFVADIGNEMVDCTVELQDRGL